MWSAKANEKFKQYHDQWLNKVLGRRRVFNWGTVESNHDIKSGDITIDIRFAGTTN
jgi:hypothetical protein